MVKRKRVVYTPKNKVEDIINGMTIGISSGNNVTGGGILGASEETHNHQHETRSKLQNQRSEIAPTKDGEIEDNQGPANVIAADTPTLRSSQRTIKKTKLSTNPIPVVQAKKAPLHIPKTKTRRAWELWSVEDTDSFFEALDEFGKDFEAMQNYISQKQRRKGVTPNLIKNKDQVRYFYYRTWHKVSKYLDLDDDLADVNKQSQELYGLINYGKLRKKVGRRLAVKQIRNLNQLIHKGVTVLRIKGKNMRVKTPLCRALKKLNQVPEEPKEEELTKTPTEISVEFRPATNKAWNYVQSLAQNPRLRVKLSMQRRLTTVIEFLQKKWQPHRLKIRQQLQPDLNEPIMPLRVQPISTAAITPLAVKTFETTHVSRICLDTHRQINNDDTNFIKDISSPISETSICDSARCTVSSSDAYIDSEKPPTDILDSCASFVNITDFQSAIHASNQSKCSEELTKDDCLSESQIRKGWTAAEAGGLLIGELHLMLGNQDPIILQYDWESDTQARAEHQLFNVLRKLAYLASSEFSDLNKPKQNNPIISSPCHCGLSGLSKTPPSNKLGKSAANTRSPATVRSSVKQQNPSTPKNSTKPGFISTGQKSPNTISDQGIFAIPSMAPPQNRSPNKVNSSSDISFIEQLDTLSKTSGEFLPRQRKIRRKPLVVQRTLLPKGNGRSRSMMPLAIVPISSQLTGSCSFMPVSSQQHITSLTSSPALTMKRIIPTSVSSNVSASLSVTTQSPASLSCSPLSMSGSQSVSSSNPPSLLHNLISPLEISTDIEASKETSKSVSTANRSSLTTALPELSIPETSNVSISTSPPSISSLFEISLPGSEGLHTSGISESEKLLDLALGNSNSSFAGFGLSTSVSAVKCIGNANSLLTTVSLNSDNRPITPAVSPTASPFKISSPGPDTQWLNGESVDFSLSSILGTIESPLKQTSQATCISIAPHIVLNESSDVDSSLQCMMNENSVDYISKFVDLAAQLTATQDTPKKTTT